MSIYVSAPVLLRRWKNIVNLEAAEEGAGSEASRRVKITVKRMKKRTEGGRKIGFLYTSSNDRWFQLVSMHSALFLFA